MTDPKLSLLYQRQAENGSETLLANIFVVREQVLRRGVIQNHTLLSSDYVAKQIVGQFGGRDRRLLQLDLDLVAAGPGFRSNPMLFAIRQDQRPRSAPACSIAMTISVWTNRSSTISPGTACEAFTTVPRSNCSRGVSMVTAEERVLSSCGRG